MLNWVDFTRQSDPAHKTGVKYLEQKLARYGVPKVFCFWTKAPATIRDLYLDIVPQMIAEGCLVLAQVTLNCYGQDMEPGISKDKTDFDGLIELLGGADHIRLRFDPVIPGYTNREHFFECVRIASSYNFDQITTNFLIPSYRGVGQLLREQGYPIFNPSRGWQINTLNILVEIAANQNITVAGCAELYHNGIARKVPGLRISGCSDPSWAVSLKPELAGVFTYHKSRPGCLCVYDDDWGRYAGRGGYRCPHNCLYCYAK